MKMEAHHVSKHIQFIYPAKECPALTLLNESSSSLDLLLAVNYSFQRVPFNVEQISALV